MRESPARNGIARFNVLRRSTHAAIALLIVVGALSTTLQAQATCDAPGCAGDPYADMPGIAPIGARIGKYIDVPEASKGPPIDPAKSYRVQQVGRGMYMVTENVYQSMFVVYEQGVVVIDAPPSLAAFIPKAIAEVTDKPITHMIYSHSHADHIGGAWSIGAAPVIIAQAETRRLLESQNDPNRPLPTRTFTNRYTLKVGSQVLQLSYHGNAHEPGNIFIYAPEQKVLMVVDVILPGWMPYRRLSLAEDIPGYFRQVAEIEKIDFDVLVSGHVTRTGTKADVVMQHEFIDDLKDAATNALHTTKPGAGLNPLDRDNPWAFVDNYMDRAAVQCVNTLTDKWSGKLAGFDVFIWDQCIAMEEAISLD